MALVGSPKSTRATMCSPVARSAASSDVRDRKEVKTERSASLAVIPDAAYMMPEISNTSLQDGRRIQSNAEQMVDAVERLFG